MVILLPQLTPSELLRYTDPAPFINELLQHSRSRRREGFLAEAERFALEALDDSREAADHVSQGAALICLADVHREMGKLGPALSDCQKAHRIFQRQPSRYQRHNEAIAAYALGLVHHLIGNDVDALKWYRAARKQFEKARREWAAANALNRVEACDYVLCWLKMLIKHLITAQAGLEANLSTRFQVPAVRLSDDEARFAIVEMEIDKYRFDCHTKISGDSFRLQPIKEDQPVSLKPGTRCYALKIPVEAYEFLEASEGDYALIAWGRDADREGPAVLEALSGPEFGSFERDDEGNIRFVSFKEAVVIGSEDITDDFGVGYIIALLKRESMPEELSSPERSKPSTPPSPEPPPTSREPELPDPYTQLLRMVGGDKGVADRLIEYERQFNPDASSSVLAESAIARIRLDNR
ncbi:MAG: tetratricopeptide repeat protein [Anaerolineae bacterium]|nr:tetratricopeptide repeat protein [Anaerolineae bacterium]